MSRLLIILLVGAMAAGCTPGRIDRIHVESSYDPQQYHFVPYTKAMNADVSGNPFGMEQQAFDTLVSETIQPPGVVPSKGSPYRVHLAFNGSTSVSKDLACRASGGGATGPAPVACGGVCSMATAGIPALGGPWRWADWCHAATARTPRPG